MSKFKIGDKVRCVRRDWPKTVGDVVVVRAVNVRLGDFDADGNDNEDCYYYDDNWELVQEVQAAAPSIPGKPPLPAELREYYADTIQNGGYIHSVEEEFLKEVYGVKPVAFQALRFEPAE